MPDDGKVLVVRICAALDQSAGVRIPPDNNAIQRRSDIGVVVQRLHALLVGLGRACVFLRRRHCRFGCVNLRLRERSLACASSSSCCAIKPGRASRCLLEAFRSRVQSRMLCLGALDLVLRPRNLFLGLLNWKTVCCNCAFSSGTSRTASVWP